MTKQPKKKGKFEQVTCPTCGNETFQRGPRGGLSVNVRCGGDPPHYFNLTFTGLEPISLPANPPQSSRRTY